MTSPQAGVRHPIFARLLVRMARHEEAVGVGEHRREALAGLAGRVIEVGAGGGNNFAHYPASVEEVVAVEPEPYLRARAAEAAARAPVEITVVGGVAERLPVPDASFDAGVAALVLCSVTNQAAALAELRRVIRPGGELRFYEHVRSSDVRLGRWQERLDRWLWPRCMGGCHVSRDTEAAIVAAGFAIERSRSFVFRPCFLSAPASPMIIGAARRPWLGAVSPAAGCSQAPDMRR